MRWWGGKVSNGRYEEEPKTLQWTLRTYSEREGEPVSKERNFTTREGKEEGLWWFSQMDQKGCHVIRTR